MNWIQKISSFVWEIPMIVLLLSTHLFMTFRLNGIQFHFIRQFKACFMHKKHDTGEISQTSALMTILASTMGTGNILGVSTAVISGGPGSVFWMVIAGFLGMATKYAETWLAVKHRMHFNNTYLGGAMVLLQHHFPVLSVFFALFSAFTALGIGCSVQSNAVALMLKNTFDIPLICTGVILSVLTSLVIVRGIKSISSFCQFLVPAAGILYFISCAFLLWANHAYFIDAVKLIVSSAFSAQSITGGMMGFSVKNAVRYGISRGLFTNEAGMGSTPLLSASSECSDPETPSYIAMFSVFLDTVIVCSITGLVFVTSTLHFPQLSTLFEADVFALSCFSLLPFYGREILSICLLLFGISTILGWCIVGEKSLYFLFGEKSVLPYRLLWILFVFLGCITDLNSLWSISDLFNALMCLPNLFMIYQYSDEIET